MTSSLGEEINAPLISRSRLLKIDGDGVKKIARATHTPGYPAFQRICSSHPFKTARGALKSNTDRPGKLLTTKGLDYKKEVNAISRLRLCRIKGRQVWLDSQPSVTRRLVRKCGSRTLGRRLEQNSSRLTDQLMVVLIFLHSFKKSDWKL